MFWAAADSNYLFSIQIRILAPPIFDPYLNSLSGEAFSGVNTGLSDDDTPAGAQSTKPAEEQYPPVRVASGMKTKPKFHKRADSGWKRSRVWTAFPWFP